MTIMVIIVISGPSAATNFNKVSAPRFARIDNRVGGPTRAVAIAFFYTFVVKARVSNVFCSTSCALALPVAGLALELRFTESTWRSPAMR
jgi:hypothetical protein